MSSSSTGPVAAPDALRHRRPGWRDPRLLLGLAVLAGSILLGAKVFAAADDTVGVWSAATDLVPGKPVTAAELVEVRVRFTGAEDADRYLSSSRPLPAGTVLQRPVGAGELLPRAALGNGSELVELPLAVEVDQVPATVRPGSRVDIWVTPAAAATGKRTPEARLVLEDCVVVAAPAARDTLAPSGTRQVIVGVEPSEAAALGPALGQVTSGRVVLTRRG